MSRITDQKISEFLDDLSSKSPTPGGGAVAAVTGAMAASLVEMVCNLTKDNSLLDIAVKSGRAKTKFLDLADEDCKAFDDVMAAYKSKDKTKIREALQKAIEVPEETKKIAGEIEKLAQEAEEKGNKNAVSDARTAIHLAQAAQKSADENIRINLDSLARLDPSFDSGLKKP